jgi:predicted ATPase
VTWPEFLFGELEACERHSAELIAYCAEKKAETVRLLSAVHYACARAMREASKENISAVRAAIDAQHRSGASISDSITTCHLAEALLMAGDVTGAEAVLQEAFAFVDQSGERLWLSDLHRVDGRIALKEREPDRARAEACFLKAIEIARSQDARLLELRAATDLARLWRDAGFAQ